MAPHTQSLPDHPPASYPFDAAHKIPSPSSNSSVPPDQPPLIHRSESTRQAPKLPTSPTNQLLPSPFPASPPPPSNSSSNRSPSPPQPSSSPSPRPPLTPFFILLEDQSTQTTHHPEVHYLFSDDSTDLLTAACLRSLSHPNSTANHTNSSASSTSLLPSPAPGTQDRYLLITLSPNGRSITSAHSLSPSWAILSTSIYNAPTFSTSPSRTTTTNTTPEQNDNGLMLHIEGTEITTSEDDGARREVRKGMEGIQDMEALLGVFEKRMRELRKVVEEGGFEGRAAGVGRGGMEGFEPEVGGGGGGREAFGSGMIGASRRGVFAPEASDS